MAREETIFMQLSSQANPGSGELHPILSILAHILQRAEPEMRACVQVIYFRKWFQRAELRDGDSNGKKSSTLLNVVTAVDKGPRERFWSQV